MRARISHALIESPTSMKTWQQLGNNDEHRNKSFAQADLLIWGSYFEGRILLADSIEVSVPGAPHSISNPLYEFCAG